MSIQLNKMRYADTLMAAGVHPDHARAGAQALEDALNEMASLHAGRANERSEIPQGVSDLKVGLVEIKSEIRALIWMCVPAIAGLMFLILYSA